MGVEKDYIQVPPESPLILGAQVLPKDGAPFLAWHLVLAKPFGSGMQQEQTLHT